MHGAVQYRGEPETAARLAEATAGLPKSNLAAGMPAATASPTERANKDWSTSMSKHALGRLGEAIRQRWQVRDGIRRLDHMDDRLLADIGVNRSDIRGSVRYGRAR
jgi:uncharacterized protein YjiS (DUF1127 family)